MKTNAIRYLCMTCVVIVDFMKRQQHEIISN
jgi:hypothetical protein